jgi:peptide/nickel transport system ATP-binding protein
VPSPANLPLGCIFEPRCDYARDECRREARAAREIECPALGPLSFCRGDRRPGLETARRVLVDGHARGRAGATAEPILSVEGAKTYYEVPSTKLIGGEKQYVKAVDDVSIESRKGKTLGIVGESGCGKSTLVKTIIGMEKPTAASLSSWGSTSRCRSPTATWN